MADTALRRFQRFVKMNERTLITVLLVILAPTFAFSFIMVDVLQDRSRGTFAWIGDRKIRHSDWQVAIGNQRVVNKALWGFQYNVANANTDEVLKSLVFQQEADRLGIRVTQREFERRIKEIYRNWETYERIKDLPQQEQQRALAKVRQEVKWDPAEYAKLAAKIFPETPIGNLEAILRQWMRIEKLQEEAISTVYVSDEDAYDSWKEENEERKLAFYRIRPDDPDILEAARAEVTDEAIRARYEERKAEYRSPLRLRFEYVKAPLSTWDGAVTLTDDELRQAYERERRWKADYRRPSVIDPMPSDVLSEAERKAVEESQYLPFEEVKDRVAESQRILKRGQAAATFMRGIVDEVRKESEGAAPAKAAEEKAAEKDVPAGEAEEKKAEPKAPVDLQAIAERHPELTYGVTPFFSQEDAEQVLGDLYAPLIAGWFRSVERSSEGEVGGRWPRQLTSKEVVYVALQPEVRRPAPLDFDAAKEIVRDELARERLASVVEEVARKKVEELRAAPESFEESAGTRTIYRTELLRRRGPLKIEGLNLPQATADRILEVGFAESGDSRIAEPAVEEDGGRAIVRIDEIVTPNPDAFTEAVKESTIRRLLAEKQRARYQAWQAGVMSRFPILRPNVAATKEGEAPPS
ncbi:MAG: SurA N-terminal domain-containing protein [Planctomycetes bacterium]|nr:SurA N-terminal domain-containing protein [Planctomycetota bacterium]